MKPYPDVENPYGYVYRTINLLNGKKYIGQHAKPEFDKFYYGSGKVLLKALDKYGKENFKIEVLGWAESKEELDQKEIWWIELFDAVNSDVFYNILIGGKSLGKGKYHPCYNKPLDEKRKNLLISYNFNRVFTQETRNKISQANSNFVLSKEHKQKLVNSNIGNRKRAKEVYQYSLDGFFIKSYFSTAEAKRQNVGFSDGCIQLCCKGKQKSHKGFRWSYLPPINGKIPSVEDEQCYQNSYKQS